ncbi:ATP-binding protein [Vitiosangium sp. GDMCC 1.1324]|uniref:ATP-binding protein n=1 Tax=Vitiosangium sp. (strain GDMCC 1.1324) TaxID=2138576 RepID=UPI0011B67A0D|nr:ATP-binding protein [Vitiosangium sp. GDMCC 1.1324]
MIHELLQALSTLSGVEWEPLAHRLTERMAGVKLRHRGQGVAGNPLGYTLDSYSDNGTIAAEYGTEAGYFKDLQKPKRDFEHVRKLLPSAEIIYLLSNQTATASREMELLNWHVEVASTEGILLYVLTARDIAEFIVDNVLESDAFAEEIGDHFEPLRRLRELHAASNLVPGASSGVVARKNVEERIQELLEAHQVVLLSGISGIGKSESAIAVANALRQDFDWSIWTSGLKIRSAADLRSVDVTRRGLQHNLLGMLSNRSCLLILDDLQTEAPIEQVLGELKASCGPSARVIVTSQLTASRPFTIEMPLLEESEARTLLEYDAPKCPDSVFRAIWAAVGGHPMALRLLNGSAREGGTWSDTLADAQQVGKLAVLEKAVRLVDLVFARWHSVVEDVLALFKWCGSARVHAEFARKAVGPNAILTLRRLGMIATDQPDTIRLHDIVWSSLPDLAPPLSVPEERFEQALDTYVRTLAADDAQTLALNHLARVHQSLLYRLTFSPRRRDGHLYAWLHRRGLEADTPDMIPEPQEYVERALRNPADDFAAQVAAELAEAVVFLSKDKAVTPEQQQVLLQPFDALIASPDIASSAKNHVRHHRAKALKRMGQYEEAVTELEALLSELGEAGTPPATRLLLARTLTELPKGSPVKNPGGRAKALLLSLLEDAKEHPAGASASVTLAAAELLRRSVVGVEVVSVIPEFSELLESLIVAATRRGLEQGPLTFAALATAWQAADEEAFWRIFKAMPIPSLESITRDSELVAWGEILVAAAEHDQEGSKGLLEEALTFFSKSTSHYAQTHAADVLIKLERAPEAVALLTKLLGQPLKTNEKAWTLFRLSQAHEKAGELGEACKVAEQAVACLPVDNKHHARFVERHAKLLSALDDRKFPE